MIILGRSCCFIGVSWIAGCVSAESVTRLSEEVRTSIFVPSLDSQLAAATTKSKSQPVDSREVLEQRYRALTDSYQNKRPRPQAWGGYCLEAHAV